MILFNKFLGIFLTSQVCIWVVQGGCPNPPPIVGGATYNVVLENETVAYKCNDDKEFSSGDTVIVCDCTNNGWYSVTATCSSGNPAVTKCNTAPGEEPPDATYKTQTDTAWTNLFRAYQCNSNKSWLSGRPIKVMTCRKGAWMKVYDICDDGCPVPRDCADVADLGLGEPGQYLVIPSGKSDGKIHSVYCILNNTDENHGGNWTYIFRQGKNQSDHKASEYINGYGNVERFNGNYFIGLQFLAEISQDFIDREVGQIMDIRFYGSSKDLKYYVTYGNFTVGTSADSYKLWSVGADHGTAGDAMCPLVNTNFDLGDETNLKSQWWASNQWDATVKNMRGNFLTSTMAWVPLETKMADLNFVEIRIRPIHKDRVVLCPPMFGSDVSWKETNASIPYERKVGTEISWECFGELFYEGMEGGERTQAGSIICEQTSSGPQWSENITLPCTVKCPNGFMLLDDGLRCFNFSLKPANNFIDATLQCQKMNSTLAVINGSTDVFKADATTSYFVNHAKRGAEQAALEFPLDTIAYNCTSDKVCQPTPEDACTLANQSIEYEHTSCDDPHSYICEIPAHCPFNYKMYGFTCYFVTSGNTFEEAYAECAKNGSTLAYPPDNWVATVLEDNLLYDFDLANGDHEFFLGVNNWQGTWDYDDFKMNAEFKSKLNDGAADKWRILILGRSSGTSISVNYSTVDITYKSSSPSTIHALCQYPGPIECGSDPMNATDYMNQTWDGLHAVGTKAHYQCWEGYFVEQNMSFVNQTIKCLGMLAEWYPTLLECERTPVCNNSLPNVTSDVMENTTNPESYYMGGNISYACPDGMAFPDGNTSLTVFCRKTDEGYQYNIMDIPSCSVCSEEVSLENTTTSWSNKSTYEIGSYVSLTCITGFQYLTGAASQNVTCTAEGWVWQSNETCYPMCSGEVSYGNATSTWANGTYTSVGSSGELECDTGFQYLSGETKQNVTCSKMGWDTSALSSCVPMCSGEEMEEGNAVSTWANGSYYFIGTQGSMECYPSYEYAPGMTTQNVTCTQTGWNMSAVQPCYSVCEGDPPIPGSNVKPFNVTSRKNGTTLTYECTAGYFEPYEPNAKPSPNITIKCNETGHWENPLGKDYYNCTELCLDDPPATPTNGTSDWDDVSYNKDTAVTYTCDPGYYFGNYSSTWIVTCNGMSWEPLDPANFKCSRVCDTDPPPEGTNEEFEWTSPYGLVGQVLQYNCSNFTANKDGKKFYTITCQDSGAWTSRPADFLCEPGCGVPAVAAPAGATCNCSNDFREGTLVRYTCSTKFLQYYTSTLDNTCSGGVWSLTEIPDCPADNPYTPVIPLKDNESPYADTADFQCSDIETCFTNSIAGEGGSYQEVKGPPGFGVAAGLSKTCRVKQGGYESETETCLLNPKNCGEEGISFSIWEKHFNYENVLNDPSKPPNADYWYIISTGGDMQGSSGFAIYHDKHYVVAVVSTGDQYWTVDAVAQSEAGSWVNIGVTWDLQQGIKLYFNATKYGESSYARNVTKKESLNPPEIMLGCHKTKSATNYTGFNNASMDEFSFWRHTLVDTKKDQEVLKFLGGYREIYAAKSPDELSQILKNIDHSDPVQKESAANIAALLLDEEPQNPTTPTPSAGPSSTAETPIANDPEGREFEQKVKDAMTFIVPSTLPKNIPLDKFSTFMKGETFLFNLLDEKNDPKWRAIQLRQDIYGCPQMVETYRTYQLEMLKNLRLENGSSPYCSKKDNKNVFNRACKMTMLDFLNSGNNEMVKRPSQYPTFYESEWGLPYDIAGVFSPMFRDEECQNRDVSLSTTIYDSLDNIMHLGVNPARLNPGEVYFLDSRLFSFNVHVDPALDSRGNVDPKRPTCNPTKADLKKWPVMFKLEHGVKEVAHRKLSFHSEEIQSDIAVRRCVVWNANYSDYGVWDPTGCEVVETTDEYTRCACHRMGTYAILGEKTHPKEVITEPKWLVILKYVLYGLSALALIIYMGVVAAAKDLKDQLHLMGANLALALLLGSIVIVVTDFDKITSDRHLCVALGALLHFFYGAVGLWMFFLGHASFNAVVSGVVSGRIVPYVMLSWGGALLLTGVPFVAFDLHALGPTNLRCFISLTNEPKFTFFIPQIIFSLLSMFSAIVVLCNLSTNAFRKENLIFDYGSFCRGASLLLLILGVTWCFGFVNYLRFDDFNETIFDPIFQVLNSSCGLCLLIFIGFGSNRFRMFIIGKSKSRRKFVKAYAFGLPDAVQGDDKETLTDCKPKAN